METKSNQKPEEKEQPTQSTHLQVKYVPKAFFQLFNKNENYIYEKKFSCDLPKNIIPPKSFHYPFSLENYCQQDLLTMDFDLKKNPEILTDSKINTLIHQDFINNTLELIFPNLTKISKKRTEEEQKFKKKIIEIIDRKDDANQDINPVFDEIPDFLRRQTYLRPSTAVHLENKSKIKDKNNEEKKLTKSGLKNSIEQSFIDIDKIKEGMKHPDQKQKGVTAKKIYDISPMDDMPNVNFVEYLFPSETSQVINLNEKYLKPEKFFIKMNKSNDISDETTCSFFINNKLKTQEDHKEKDRAEYYSYETDFTANKISESDIFNRYFFILDKVTKKLKISRLTDKYSLRRYKRIMEETISEEDENGNKKLGKKRRRNIITVPQSMEKEEFDKKKKWLNERGYNSKLVERKIEAVDHTDVNEIEREIEEEIERNKQIQNENEEQEEMEEQYEQEENNEKGEYENEEDDEDVFNENGQGEENNEEENENNNEENNENEGENENDDNVENNEDNNEHNNDEEEDENNNESEHEKEEKEENEEKEEKEKEENDDDGEDVFN